jgi:hypothetical protein
VSHLEHLKANEILSSLYFVCLNLFFKCFFMNSFSEKSFGARLLRAHNIFVALQAFSGYNPPEANQTVAAFGSFLDDVAEANALESQIEKQYKQSVVARKAGFRDGTVSVLKLLPQIRGAVEAKFGKNSQQYEAVSAIIKKMTATKLIKAPLAGEGADVSEAISQSQQSYGSLLGYFNDLINTLSEFTGYDPSNIALKVVNLQNFSVMLNSLNASVAQKYLELHQQRKERLNFYSDLNDRVQKIKAYVKAEYGVKSGEYEQIKGVEV